MLLPLSRLLVLVLWLVMVVVLLLVAELVVFVVLPSVFGSPLVVGLEHGYQKEVVEVVAVEVWGDGLPVGGGLGLWLGC